MFILELSLLFVDLFHLVLKQDKELTLEVGKTEYFPFSPLPYSLLFVFGVLFGLGFFLT